MTNRLFIIGAGGFGREVAVWATHWLHQDVGYALAGFLDDNPKALDGFPCDWPLLGNPREFAFREGDGALIAIGSPKIRRELATMLDGRVQFPTLVHPAAIVGPHCALGAGTIICPGTIVTTNVRFGRHVIINLGCSIGHDVTMGDHVTLSPHVSVSGGASLGDEVFVGSNASFVPRVKVGARSVVGAGSLVLRPVPEGVTVFGLPAKQHGG
jgi:sugar O-acyltransferase (sialic acid O-acetyltransferase NeuD family)